MSTEHRDEEAIFYAALKIKSQPERDAYIKAACGNNIELLKRIEALLKANDAEDSFLEIPAAGPDVTLDNAPSIEGPGTKIGRYELLELIGEGGMGLVYLAQQKEPVKRKVAFKIVKLGMDTKQVVARFEAEKQALALLDHPNIAHVFDAGTTETGRPYFVMEYVKGMSIVKYSDERKLNIEQRLRLFEQVCEGVHHAHQKGIIHRDLKPSNILVSVHGDRAVPKIIDFGIAKAITQPLTDKTFVTFQGQLLGTPEYMSPEQVDLATQDIDTRSDIYSLGVVLYELLAGVLPFEKESFEKAGFAEIQRTIRELEPASPSIRLTNLGQQAKTIAASRGTQVIALARRLHRELEWIPLKAMRKDRCRRYRSASELADDVRNYLNGLPLIAGPETAIYRVRKFVHKHAGSVATVAIVAVAIILGLVISTIMYFRAENALDKEAIARTTAEKAQKAEQEQRKLAEDRAEDLRRSNYVNSIQLADAKYREGNIRRVRELLASCPNDLRGWEWNRLNYIADQSKMTLRSHSRTVSSVAMSLDGKHVVSSSWDNTIEVWDVIKGTELITISREHGNAVTCVALGPGGRRVVAGDNSGQIDIWDVPTGKEVMTLKGHDNWVSCVAFSPDGTRIVSGSWNGTTKIWDAVTGTKLTTLKSNTGAISSVTFSQDGKRIASAGFNGQIKVFDAITTEELMTLKGQGMWGSSVAFSPDNKFIVSTGDNNIKIWDSKSGAELMTLRGHEGGVNSVAVSPDGKRIASGGADNTIKIWYTATGENIVTFRGHEASVGFVAFTPDGKQIVSSGDNTIKLWDVGTDRELTRFVRHAEKIYSVAFSPDGRRIVSASQDGTVKVWDVESGTEVMSIPAGGGTPLVSTALSPDGKHIASPTFWDNTVKLWDAATGVETMTLRGHEAPVFSIVFSPDNKQLASGGLDKTIKIWNIATAKEVMTLSGHNKAIWSVAFSPDGKRIASVGSDFAPPVSLNWQGEIKVWDSVTGSNLMTVQHDVMFPNVAFSPDGSKIVCGSRDGTIKVWDPATGAELMTFRGHAEPVLSVAFSPDGRRIVSASRDRTAKVWDSTTGNELLTLRDYAGLGLMRVTFSPDGKSLAAGTVSGSIVLWGSVEPGGGYGQAQAGEVARKLVDELYQKHGYYYEVISKLQADKILDERVREIALQIANSRCVDDVGKFTTEVLEVIALPDKDIETYQQALKKVEMANNFVPDNPYILTILGMAQYRVGTYQEAINTLTTAEKIWEQMWEQIQDPIAANIAFIARAMSSHKLGQYEQTEAALQRIRDLRKEERLAEEKQTQAFLDEAEKLIAGEKH